MSLIGKSLLGTLLLPVLASAVTAGWCGDGRCDRPESCGECPADCGGCEPVRITTATGDDYDPAWSSDAVTLAFLSERNGNGAEIFAIDADGSDERPIARFGGGPAWQFADLSWMGTTDDLLAIDLRNAWEVLRIRLSQGPPLPLVRPTDDGGTPYMTPLLVVPGGKAARGPVVSPDGLHLAWGSLANPWFNTACEGRVYELRIHDGNLETLIGTSDSLGRVLFATAGGGYLEGRHPIAFSPDGREVAFVAAPRGWCSGTKRDVYIVDVETGQARQLTTDGAQGVDHGSVSWSSRNVLAFDAGGDLYTILPDGSGLRRVTATVWNESDAAWSPDGNRLAYTANRDGGYDIFTLDGLGVLRTGEVRPRRRLGRYIVVLQEVIGAEARTAADRATAVTATAIRLLDGRRTRLVRVYAHTIKGFSARISRLKARRLAQAPEVAYVEEDRRVYASEVDESSCPVQPDPPSWGLDRIDQARLPLDHRLRYRPTGAGVNVYVIDTGIWTTHEEFGGRAQMVFSYNGGSGADCNGHGTHVAATIAGTSVGVAKSARVFGLKVLDCNGNGWDSDVIAAVDWTTANHAVPAVANMSLGGGISLALDEAVRRSIRSGVTYVVAAGNDARDAATTSPARVAEALTVAASDSDDRRASDSSFGSIVDLFAPGVDIVSAWVSSDRAKATLSGTSMATPHVAGVAAVYLLANPGASPQAVANMLLANTTPGRLIGVPSGTPNRLLRIFGSCAATCGDGIVNQPWEECDDRNATNGDGCDGCYLPRYPCDVQCCDGSTWQHVRARTADECRSFSAGSLCNRAGNWTGLYFAGARVGSAACSDQCGIECCSWSVTQRVGGIRNMRGTEALCANLGQEKCGAAGSGLRNALFYPGGVGHCEWNTPTCKWVVKNACQSAP
jgi:cysteine-rich repeat protein